ncbi:MAG: haloalkane dehalogenase [Polyangiales bacterium]
MELLETPESRFANLPDFPWKPHYVVVDPSGARMAYVDEGPREAPVVLLLHGEPSWSFLYRKMIPTLLDAGLRVVAPDLIGFGRSSKPTKVSDHSYARHVAWMGRFLDEVGLRDITLFGQDWGSLIGLRLVGEQPERFTRVVIGNGFLPKGDPPPRTKNGLRSLAAFLTWRTFALYSPIFVCSKVLDVGSATKLSEAERRAYDAPFPDRRFLAGPRAMPGLVPITPRDPARRDQLAAWKGLEAFDKPFLTLFSTGDPIMGGLDKLLQKAVPGAQGQPHRRVRGGHFLQEDSGPELAKGIVDFLA